MDIYTSFPCPFDVNEVTRKAKFLLGDRWILIGEIVIGSDKNDLFIEVPDVEQFLASREHLDDGTLDWAEWGPRMN